MRAVIVAAALAGVLALAGCASSSSPARSAAPSPANPTPAASAPVTPTAVTPVVPDHLTEASAGTETTRIADAIQALIDPAVVVHVDDHAQLVDRADGKGRYFGVLRTLTLDPATDPVAISAAIVATLKSSGWLSRNSSTVGGVSVNALTSDTAAASAWFVVIGGDASMRGESVVSLQLASPDIP